MFIIDDARQIMRQKDRKILLSRDWQHLIQLCKAEIQNTTGDRRAARGLLYRLTFYISENRLVKPSRRKKEEPPIQKPLFDGASRGEPSIPGGGF